MKGKKREYRPVRECDDILSMKGFSHERKIKEIQQRCLKNGLAQGVSLDIEKLLTTAANRFMERVEALENIRPLQNQLRELRRRQGEDLNDPRVKKADENEREYEGVWAGICAEIFSRDPIFISAHSLPPKEYQRKVNLNKGNIQIETIRRLNDEGFTPRPTAAILFNRDYTTLISWETNRYRLTPINKGSNVYYSNRELKKLAEKLYPKND